MSELTEQTPRNERPANQLFDKCSRCNDPFKSGDAIAFDEKMNPICYGCRK